MTEDENPFGITPDDIRRLAALIRRHGLSELHLEQSGISITVRSETAANRAAVEPKPDETIDEIGDGIADEVPVAVVPTTPSTVASTENLEMIAAPVMGVYYRAPGIGEPAFVDVGDTVEIGQPVGMIEAMKVFSEVLSEQRGTIRTIPAKNGALVQPGEPLIWLDPLGN